MEDHQPPLSDTCRKRCRRHNEPGHAHGLTFSCFQRQPFLSRDRSRQWLIDAIERARARHSFHLWAYVIMPEHAHLLVYPAVEGCRIEAILTSVKKSVSNRAIVFVRSQAPEFLARMTDRQPNGKVAIRFWQRGGGYDRNLWNPRYIWEMIDYIHGNPVRRGLCRGPLDWPWSSACEYRQPGSGLIRIDGESLPPRPRS